MRKNSFIRSAALALALLSAATPTLAEICDPSVSAALDKQRTQYIAAAGDLADQNYSRRPGTFAATTCLDSLMKAGGVDIFFKPPSLDTILNLVKNFACEQATQIFDNLVGGSGVNGGLALKAGELLSGINLGGGSSTSGLASSILGSGTSSTTSVDTSLRKLFQ